MQAGMLEQEFEQLYLKFRKSHYKVLFGRIKEKPGSLSATEAFSAEVIYLLGNPTVRQFAEFIDISQPNATYKINALVAKGYLQKITSEQDKREFHLQVTDKFLDYYGSNAPFIIDLMKKIREQFSSEEVAWLEKIIARIHKEMMD
jgi:DNA-binding MarR family transcriptional regulator